ncbi:MAG: response regulator transcription factor [Chloroflexi bacterium]|nr:response regulator transcription factor [Chloroflexota bacterium]
MLMRLLLVEDDAKIACLVQQALTESGHETSVADDGLCALIEAQNGDYDLIILDILLPRLDGLEVCRRLRARRIKTPILMLTARDRVPDRVRGLDAGADDYLVKPFAMEELLARIRAFARRNAEEEDEPLVVADLRLDLATHTVERNGTILELTPKEFELLAYLMRHPGRVLTKDQILEQVWGYDSDVLPGAVELYVHYLRQKVDRASAEPLIRTVRGVGYCLKR